MHVDEMKTADRSVSARIETHQLNIFKLSESISDRLPNASGTRDSNASDGFGNTHPAALQADLNYYKELFSKLRFSYLEQVTKEKFLRAITEDPPLIVEREENTKLEEELRIAKTQLQDSKITVDGILAQLDDLSRRLSSEYRQLVQDEDEVHRLPSEAGNMEATVAQLRHENQDRPEFSMPLPETVVHIGMREAELSNFEGELQALDGSIPERQQHLDTLNTAILPMQTDKAGLERFASEAVRQRDSARAAGKADRENTGQWYRSSYETLSALLGDDEH